MTENLNDKIIIYQSEDGKTQLDVKLEGETVWLTQAQMVELFQSSKATISEHIKHIIEDDELDANSTVRKFRTVQQEGKRQVSRIVAYYNLVKGYAINENIRKHQIAELRQLIQVLGRAIQQQPAKTTDESNALFDVVVDYTYALDTLDNYDYQRLHIAKTTKEEPFHATYENAMHEIDVLRQKFGGSVLFGNEKDESFKSSIGQIYQTFDGTELYPSVEEKAAMLLYLVTKNHSFSDGNKRIAATLFLWFMNNNAILYRPNGTKRIADNTLVALTLMIAESKTEEKDIMVKVVVNLINQAN